MTTAIIDSNSVLTTGLHTILQRQFESMHILNEESVVSFHQKYGDINPDLVIFSEYSEANVVAEISKLKGLYKPGAIIIYDAIFNVNKIRKYFKVGVTGCISRKSGEPGLLRCVCEVLEGRNHISQDFQELILNQIFSEPQIPKGKFKNLLSSREKEIALYLSNGHKTTWIAKELERKPSTISTIKSSIFRKLNIHSVIELKQIIL